MLRNMFSAVDLDTEGQKISNNSERQVFNDTRADMGKKSDYHERREAGCHGYCN